MVRLSFGVLSGHEFPMSRETFSVAHMEEEYFLSYCDNKVFDGRRFIQRCLFSSQLGRLKVQAQRPHPSASAPVGQEGITAERGVQAGPTVRLERWLSS